MEWRKYFGLLVFCGLQAVSQSSIDNGSTNGRMLFFQASDVTESAEGSPYITEAYLPAKAPGSDFVVPPLRYQAEKDEMEFMRDSKRYYLKKRDSLEIVFANKRYQYLTYSDKNLDEEGYLVVLLGGKSKFTLYKKEKITFIPKVEAKSSYDHAKPAQYKRNEDKFYIGFDHKIVSLPKKKKEVLTLLPGKAAAIEEFLKTNKIAFDNESDLLKLVNYLNSL